MRSPDAGRDAPRSILITHAGPERLDELEPLWIAMQRHHETIAPAELVDAVGGFRSERESWRRRRAIYADMFRSGTAVLHVAEAQGSGLVGYAMVRIGGGWSQLASPEPMAELESLSVLPEHRGRGVGSRLLAAVHADLRERGVRLVSLAVFAGNEAAARFYAAHGMRLQSTHMVGRVPAR